MLVMEPSKARSAAGIAALLLGLSCGNQGSPGSNSTGIDPGAAVSTVALPDVELTELNDKLVLEALFPQATFVANGPVYSWIPDPEMGLPLDAHGSTTTGLLTTLVGPDLKALVFESFAPGADGRRPTCHACAPMLSVAVFKGAKNRPWRLTAWAPAFARHGQNGKAGDLRILTLGKDRQAMELSMTYRAAGQGSGRADIYDLTDLNKVLSVDTYSSFEHMAGGKLLRHELKTTFSFLPSEKSHFDVELHTKGHRVDMQANTRTAVEKRVRMSYDGTKYVVVN